MSEEPGEREAPQPEPEPDERSAKPTPLRRGAGRRRPEQTSDDTDRGWGERPDEDEHDRWLREQRPPHWE